MSIKRIIYSALRLTEEHQPKLMAYPAMKIYDGSGKKGQKDREEGIKTVDIVLLKNVHPMFLNLKATDIERIDDTNEVYLIVHIYLQGVKKIFVLFEKVPKATLQFGFLANGNAALETTYAADWGSEKKVGGIFVAKVNQCCSCGASAVDKKDSFKPPSFKCPKCKGDWFVWCDKCCYEQDKEFHGQICAAAKSW